MITIVDAHRPETKAEEDAILLAAFRGALERISRILEMPGSPDLVHAVPEEVEGLVRSLKELVAEIATIRPALVKTQDSLGHLKDRLRGRDA